MSPAELTVQSNGKAVSSIEMSEMQCFFCNVFHTMLSACLQCNITSLHDANLLMTHVR